MEQRALGELAEELGQLAALQSAEAANQIGLRIRQAAAQHRLSPQALTTMVAGEWVRLGMVPPGGELLNLGSGLDA